jgi:hypothetical protein
LLFLRLFHWPFLKVILGGERLISRIDRSGEAIMEGGIERGAEG